MRSTTVNKPNAKLAATGAILTTPVWILLLVPWATSPALAADPNGPPDWWTYDPNNAPKLKVGLGYSFDDPNHPKEPDPGCGLSPYGPPEWQPDPNDPNSNAIERRDSEAGRNGVWGVWGSNKHGSIIIKIKNGPLSTNVKIVWISYDWKSNHGNPPPPVTVRGERGTGDNPGANDAGKVGKSDPDKNCADGWKTHWELWTIDPQPASETIRIDFRTGGNGGFVAIDNLKIGTFCVDENEVKHHQESPQHPRRSRSQHYFFGSPAWPPPADYEIVPAAYAGTTWQRAGSAAPDWMPWVTDRFGVFGLPGGPAADGQLAVLFDELEDLSDVKNVHYQFDYYAAEGGMVWWEPVTPPGAVVENLREELRELGNGWQEVRLAFEIRPAPDWHGLQWYLVTAAGGGPVAVDDLLATAGSPEATRWFEDVDFYETGGGLHGQYGWKGWDNNPAADGWVTEAQAYSNFKAADIVDSSDLVHEFANYTFGQWAFTAWAYVPSDFVSGCDPSGNCGSYFILLNTYQDGGPYQWSVQLHADSVTQSFIRDQQVPAALPLVTDQWVQIKVLIDLDADVYRVFYDGEELGAAASWSAGVYGGGGGALDIAALDLFANGSTSVYWDDISLVPAYPVGDLNCDGEVGFGDINPFVLALSNPDGYVLEFLACDIQNGDINRDGSIGFGDINPFVALLTGGS
jgi:hypothetical protein